MSRVNIDRVVKRLNKLAKADSAALLKLFTLRISCNDAMSASGISTSFFNDTHQISLFGVLNYALSEDGGASPLLMDVGVSNTQNLESVEFLKRGAMSDEKSAETKR